LEKQNKKQISNKNQDNISRDFELEKAIFSMAAILIDPLNDNPEDKFKTILGIIVEFTNYELAYLMFYDSTGDNVSRVVEFSNSELSICGKKEDFNLHNSKKLKNLFLNERSYNLEIDAINKKYNQEDILYCKKPGFKRVAAVMLTIGLQNRGQIGIISKKDAPIDDYFMRFLSISAEILTGYIIKHEIFEKLLASRERYRLAIEGSRFGVWDWEINTDNMQYSHLWATLLGLDFENFSHHKKEWFDRIHPEDLDAVMNEFDAHFNKKSNLFCSEHRIKNSAGVWVWVKMKGVAAFGIDGRPTRIVGTMEDITEKKRTVEELTREASYDYLTGIYNRRYFMKGLASAVRTAKRYKYPLAFVIFDVDKFKDINDFYGHQAGDLVLMKIGSILQEEIREDDVAGRYGGDEFCLYFPLTDEKDAYKTVERITRKIKKSSFTGTGGSFKVTVSCGLASLKADDLDHKYLFSSADHMLYLAKDMGRDVIMCKEQYSQGE